MSEVIDRIARAVPGLARTLARVKVNAYARAAPPRPHRYSLWSPGPPPPKGDPTCGDWTAWPGLFDASYTGRHLGCVGADTVRPDADAVIDLFRRPPGAPAGRASALFGFFAQWFTDSFLRTMPDDRRRTDSNHEIDLCQVYGLDETTTRALRALEGGLLATRQGTNGGQFAPLLFQGEDIDPAYLDLSYLRPGAHVSGTTAVIDDRAQAWRGRVDRALGPDVAGPISDPARRGAFYAFGLDRGGSTIVYSAINTIFIREHNGIARLLAAEYPRWDDERLFQTARLINMRQALTVVVESYISFIGGLPIPLDRDFAEDESWYRPNRTSVEFNLLYRWHGLTPDTIMLGGRKLGHRDYRYNNALLEEQGVGGVLTAASNTPAGRAELGATPEFMLAAERGALSMARHFRLHGFNAYRERFGMERYRSIDELTRGSPHTADLERVYGSVDEVEFTVGLFAEGRDDDDLFGETLTAMVAHDAFTHILTNPLLAREVHVPEIYSEAGLALIEERATFADIVARNTEGEGDVAADFRAPALRRVSP